LFWSHAYNEKNTTKVTHTTKAFLTNAKIFAFLICNEIPINIKNTLYNLLTIRFVLGDGLWNTLAFLFFQNNHESSCNEFDLQVKYTPQTMRQT